MLHDAFLFLIAGIASAAFGLIYEFFSHEVYSFYMIYAFLIPLVPGTLLNLVIVWRAVRKEKCLRNKEDAERRAMKAAEAEPYEDSEERGGISAGTEAQAGAGVFFPGPFTRHSWNSGLAALTIGSIFKGVLDIYGTTNKWIRIAIKIQDLHPGRLNLDKYPLMPFHQEVSSIDANGIRINIDLPKNPFALHMLKSRLGYYTYTVLNDTDPFTLFSEEQYNNEVYFPVAL